MLINSPNISGSLKVTGNTVITGSLTVLGGINATITGSATTASYVEYSNVANKPALVSGSSQVTYSGLTGVPSGIVSGSSQITYSGISSIPSGIVSSSTQITGYNIFATTGSNQFNGSQAVTGSLTVTGQVVAQTLNVQQVTSSIVYSSGSNIFGNNSGNTQQFTGSVSVTGSLAVSGNVGIGTTNPSNPSGFAKVLNISNTDAALVISNTNGTPKNYTIGVVEAGNLLFIDGTTTRMAISASGSVGIGVIPNTNSLNPAFDLKGGAGIFGYGDANYLTGNLYYDGAFKLKNAGTGSFALLDDGFTIYTTNGGSANASVTATPRLRLTNGGNVLIGTTTDASGKLQVLGSDNTIISQIKSSSGMIQIYPYLTAADGPIIQALDGAGSNYKNLRIECIATTIKGPNSIVTDGSAANINLHTTTAYAANIGGTIGFGGLFNGSASTEFAVIAGKKENATINNLSGYLAFYTRGALTDPIERMRITSSGITIVGHTAGIGTNFSPPIQVKGGAGIGNGFGIISGNNEMVGGLQLASSGTNSFNIAADPDNLQPSTEIGFTIDGSPKMTINSSGFVGIGTTPSYLLHIPQNNNIFLSNLYITGTANNPVLSSGATGGSMSLEGGGAEQGKIYLQGAGSGGNGYIEFYAGGSLRMTIADNGSIGAPSGTNIYNASDLRLKRNISTISNGLDKISALNPIKFNWIDGFEPSEDGKDMLGFVAQEVYEIIPEAVESFSGNSILVNDIEIQNPLRINEKFIIPVLVKAIQEQQSQIEILKTKIEILEQS